MNLLDLGPAVARTRKARGILQADLCRQLRLSRVTLSAFENSRSLSMSLATLQRILNLLDLELDLKERRALPTLDELAGSGGL
jgi:transcriptional regulator with XRE-family HTH domain